jgi:hypothetical protein
MKFERLDAGWRRCALVLAWVFVASGCSDPGSGGTGVPDSASAGGVSAPALSAPGQEVLRGAITRIEGTSIVVDQRTFDASTARVVTIDGRAATLADLRVGQRVAVTAVADRPAQADTIVIESDR